VSTAEILEQLPKLNEAERRAVREKLLELATKQEESRSVTRRPSMGPACSTAWRPRMPAAHRGEVWVVDFGIAAKVRPALLLTDSPSVDELDLVTLILHTTALRGNRWELSLPKPFLKPGAFHLQQVQTVPTVRLERRLGALTAEEMGRVEEALRRRLGI